MIPIWLCEMLKHEKLNDIIESIKSAPSFEDIIDTTDVVSITGRRRHGKSVLLYKLLDDLSEHYGVFKYAWGIPLPKRKFFNNEIEHFDDIEDIEDMSQSCIGCDEIHRVFSARSSMRDLNKRISELMTFTGQRNQILILATLNNALIDIDTFRITNPILIYKRVGRLQANSERRATKEYTMKASKEWLRIPHGKKGTNVRLLECSLSYVVSDEYEGWIYNNKPEWWNESASEVQNIKTEDKENNHVELNDYRAEYEQFIFQKVIKYPIDQQNRMRKQLKREYHIEKYYL